MLYIYVFIYLEAAASRDYICVPFSSHCEGETIKQRHLSSEGTLEPTKDGGFHTKTLLSLGCFGGGRESSTASSCRALLTLSSLSLGFVGPRNKNRKCAVASLAVNSACPQAV